MINQDLKNTKFIFDKMKKLYPSFVMPDELDVEVWTEILEGYSQTDILEALKSYRKNVPYNVAPTPAAFRPFLHHEEKTTGATVAEEAKADFAWQRMDEDIEKGKCNWNMPTYRMAERIVLEEWLSKEMPVDLWQRMDYYGRVKQAKEKGLFDRFDDALVEASRRKFGKDYQFESENDIKSARNAAGYAAADYVQSTPPTVRSLNSVTQSAPRGMTDNESRHDIAKTLAAHWKMELN